MESILPHCPDSGGKYSTRKKNETDLEIYLRRRFAESYIFWGIREEEDFYAAEIASQIEGLEVWRKVYSQIPGMGPKIAGRIASAIGDIRRFETAYALACYFGWHVRKDGTCPKRKKGLSPEMRKEMAARDESPADYGGWNGLGRQGTFLWCEQVNRATPERDPDLYRFKEKLVGRKGYLARKAWVHAALETAGGPDAVPPPPAFLDGWQAALQTTTKNSEATSELKAFLTALENSGENWFRAGVPLREDSSNPYLVCCREPRIVERPWELRDALAELLKRAGEDVPDEDMATGDPEVTEEIEQQLLDDSDEQEKVQKWKYGLPKMELQIELVRELRRFIRTTALSKKRIHQGSYRWLVNEVLIRKHLWPLNRQMLGLTTSCDPRPGRNRGVLRRDARSVEAE